jgi:1,4-dihydroxy-6-naphthoate synthase
MREHRIISNTMSEILLRLGHSPDPDDAFMFYALARDQFSTKPYRFEHILQDIQTLNQRAMAGELEITAISIHAYPYVADKYALTSCGSSMGDKYGPIVVATRPMTLADLNGKTIAIPGELTTAFLALQLCIGKGKAALRSADGKMGTWGDGETGHPATANFPLANNNCQLATSFSYVVVPFDQILQHVKEGKADAGLIIHEGQLTYQQLGLHLVVDLGVWWHEQTGLPLPLGGNCIRKDLGPKVMQEVTSILRKSIQYSLDHRTEAVEYALQYGRDLNRKLADQFVGMYVNKWTLDYGPIGRQAISLLLQKGAEAKLVPAIQEFHYITAE